MMRLVEALLQNLKEHYIFPDMAARIDKSVRPKMAEYAAIRGGAHPVRRFRLDEHYEVTTPFGRSVNPITGTNWEGVGVTPDIAVPDADAFKTAYADALTKHVIPKAEKDTVRPWRNILAEAQKALAELS